MTFCGRSRPRRPAGLLLTALALVLMPDLSSRTLRAEQTAETDLPTVAAVQGNDSNGLNLASLFLTGCQYCCLHPEPQQACYCQCTGFHSPTTWPPPTQLHVPDTTGDYSKYYWDKTYVESGQSGLDEASPNGLEGYRILFYAGDGTPQGFQAGYGKWVDLWQFSLGDGSARYLYMVSCNVFAHGPRTNGDYSMPQKFEPKKFDLQNSSSATYQGDANVFYRWGRNYGGATFRSPLNKRLRVACGGSSTLGNSSSDPAQSFWPYFSSVGLGPADSFLVSVYDPGYQEVPLCISRGDSFQDSGLPDSRFEKDELVPDTKKEPPQRIYIEYPVAGDPQDPLLAKLAKRSGVKQLHGPGAAPPADTPLPILIVKPAPVPEFLTGESLPRRVGDYGFLGGSAKELKLDTGLFSFGPSTDHQKPAIEPDDFCVERHPLSGSLILSWRPVAHEGGVFPFDELHEMKNFDAMGDTLLQRLVDRLPAAPKGEDPGQPAIVMGDPVITQMKIDSALADDIFSDDPERVAKFQHEPDRCVHIIQPTYYRQGNLEVRIYGPGSETFVRRCPVAGLRRDSFSLDVNSLHDTCTRAATPLVSLWFNAPVYKDKKKGKPRSRGDAEKDALKQLKPLEAYTPKPVRYRQVYRAAPPHCSQMELYPFYQFYFLPKPGERFKDFPPRTIEVPAQDLDGKRVADPRDCGGIR